MRQDDDDLHLAASSDTFLSTLMARNTLPTLRTFLLISYDDDNDDSHDEDIIDEDDYEDDDDGDGYLARNLLRFSTLITFDRGAS